MSFYIFYLIHIKNAIIVTTKPINMIINDEAIKFFTSFSFIIVSRIYVIDVYINKQTPKTTVITPIMKIKLTDNSTFDLPFHMLNFFKDYIKIIYIMFHIIHVKISISTIDIPTNVEIKDEYSNLFTFFTSLIGVIRQIIVACINRTALKRVITVATNVKTISKFI